FNDDAFGTSSVELGIVNLLPRSEIQLACCHRYYNLVVHEQALEVRIAIGFPGLMMTIVLPERGEMLQPFVDIGDQPVFGVIDVNCGRNVHGRDQNHAFPDTALLQRRFDFGGDVDVVPMVSRTERVVLGVKLHKRDIPTGCDSRNNRWHDSRGRSSDGGSWRGIALRAGRTGSSAASSAGNHARAAANAATGAGAGCRTGRPGT